MCPLGWREVFERIATRGAYALKTFSCGKAMLDRVFVVLSLLAFAGKL